MKVNNRRSHLPVFHYDIEKHDGIKLLISNPPQRSKDLFEHPGWGCEKETGGGKKDYPCLATTASARAIHDRACNEVSAIALARSHAARTRMVTPTHNRPE